MAGEHLGPNRVVGIRQVRNDPEALPGMMDDGDGFAGGGADGPGAPQEVQRVIGVEATLDIEG